MPIESPDLNALRAQLLSLEIESLRAGITLNRILGVLLVHVTHSNKHVPGLLENLKLQSPVTKKQTGDE